MKSNQRLILSACILTLVLIYSLPKLCSPIQDPPPTAKPPLPSQKIPAPAKRQQDITFIGDSELSDQLASKNQPPEKEMRAIHSLLHLYRRALGGNPTGENEEITRALTGRNPKHVAVLSENHPSISRQGELHDRWGTPYFFHALSGTRMEIRSAGADGKFYTDDDILSHP